MSSIFYKIAVDAPINETLTYLPPDGIDSLQRGQAVVAPLAKRTVTGVVVDQTTEAGSYQIKPLKSLHPEWPLLPEKYLNWLEWIANYYMYPPGQVFSLAFPPLKKSGRSKKSEALPIVPDCDPIPAPEMTQEQAACHQAISTRTGFDVHLIHGVTGSGKTEVYLRLLADIIAKGQRGLVLVPEISLTPQLIRRFSSRFPNEIAVIHSHLTEREKTNQWWQMVLGEKKILIGARSALFCPISDLGLIVIDEEHEPSFKQDEKFKYHARDSAIMLAKLMNCPILLGSATPSLESWHNSKTGKYCLHTLSTRVENRSMPRIEVIDLKDSRQENPSADRPFWLTPQLHQALHETLARKEQAALFLNRRGVAQTALCEACGFTYECPNCAIGLTLHGRSHLVCHYCDYTEHLKGPCPQCADGVIRPLGLGTELLEKDLQSLFPDVCIGRADRDEIHSREDMESLILRVENREIQILIGTQMIAKGLDFPGLTLVGLVLADVGFHLPDFRASERSFQLLTQMSGRSGRHSENPGQVIIQTYNPLHPSITFTQNHDFLGFAEQELKSREELLYPPFGKLALIKIQGRSFEEANQSAQRAKSRCLQLQKERTPSVRALGPAPAPLAKLRGQYRFQILLKSNNLAELSRHCHLLLGDQKWVTTGTKVQIDIDPINMM